ncbi:OmpA-OmpF porin, OOP family [Solimonas aquatica]|uniref:OmpA-OmpF porin, OOP family n=1 Tax=Solimonas aquatica TaxID=489703 RepID=A0A1H9LEP9_9GAMM|nr:OmpA family protein [Solimonas aquatica]SER09961.1 OmpA-OmpF porin, OOP family [Solimonas aquatica]
MNHKTRVAAALLLGALATPVLAAETDALPYLSGGYAYTFDDSARHSDAGQGLFLGAGAALNPFWGLELSLFGDRFASGGNHGNRWQDYGLKLDTQFFYSRDPAFSPYVGIGVGAMYSKLRNGNDSSSDPFIDFGVGFLHYFSGFADGRLGFRADARYRWVDLGDTGNAGHLTEPVLRVGLVWALGEKSEPVKPVLDADGDGVPDERDRCPDTPKGVKVDANGCPLDSDGDGVPDSLDQCPGTAPGVAVDARGCPARMGSGRFKISGSGAVLRFEDVHFAFDHDELSDYAKAMLDDAAQVINDTAQKYPALKVDISGHTDAIGSEGYNQALSERRAQKVKQYLVRKGVDEGRISLYSYGESKPEVSNDTEDGRAQNRRAETRTREE